MRPSPRDEVLALAPTHHGGGAPQGLLDFSTGISPLPAPPSILAAARAAPLDRYPHPEGEPLRSRLSAREAITPAELVVGAGSVELIWALARAFGGPGRRALVVSPAFAEYAQAARASGAEVCELRRPGPPFHFDLAAALDALATEPALAFFCRPSNPCLDAIDAGAILHLAARHPRTLFVADEAYLPLFDSVCALPRAPNLARLRSLTKIFALPGLRLGYLMADADIAQAVQRVLPPWNVSSPAIAAGRAAVDALDEAASIRRDLRALRLVFESGLRAAGARISGAGGPFLLCDVGDAAAACAHLDALGCRVRDASSFGLPTHVRIGVRPIPEQERLARAFASL
jgi:histidinol-phosphate/aromatic aminotransferase/cobyric acid decarboxylase-like protein